MSEQARNLSAKVVSVLLGHSCLQWDPHSMDLQEGETATFIHNCFLFLLYFFYFSR